MQPIIKIILILLFSFHFSFSETLNINRENIQNLSSSLTMMIKELRKSKNIQIPWPKIKKTDFESPRKIYTRALEILSKINNYRLIHHLGEIYLPKYSVQKIDRTKVYNLLKRLNLEMRILIPQSKLLSNKTNSDLNVLSQLLIVSKAFDPLFGKRGFSKGSLYAQSLYIFNTIKFLRRSQNLETLVIGSRVIKGKHSNHVLSMAYKLREKIVQSQTNLWMKKANIKVLEKRVITPIEVYDELQNLIYELDRIKFRLGIESKIEFPKLDQKKGTQETLQNLHWAQNSIPLFLMKNDLHQFNRISLNKTSEDVYFVVYETLKLLKYYVKYKGIRVKATKPTFTSGLETYHAYKKTLECLKKVSLLRKSVGLIETAKQELPSQKVTFNDLFSIVSQLNFELKQIYKKSEMKLPIVSFIDNEDRDVSDIYFVLWKISYELDVVLGTKGHTPSDVFGIVKDMANHAKLLGEHLGYTFIEKRDVLQMIYKPKDVFMKAQIVLEQIKQIKKRSGLFNASEPITQVGEIVTPNDVYNLMNVISAEFREVEIYLGTSFHLDLPIKSFNKTPSHVYQELSFVESLFNQLLGGLDE